MAMTREEALTIVASIVREHSRGCREPKPCQDCELEAEAIAALSAQADTKQAEPLSPWQPIESAPISTPMEQQWFWGYAPDCPYGYGVDGCQHLCVRYEHTTKVQGSNNDQRVTHWQPIPSPPALHQLGAKVEVSDG